jgi:hypothetical protein
VALAVVTVPAATVFVETSYVDNLVLLAFLGGLALLLEVRLHRDPPAALAVLAGLAFGVGAATKQSFLPLALAGWAWLAVVVGRRRPVLLAALAPGAAVGLVWYGRAWVDRGSPLYPFRVPVPGAELASSEALADVVDGTAFGVEVPDLTIGYLLDAAADTLDVLREPMNLAVAPLLWLALAAAGLVQVVRGADRRDRWPTAYLLLAVAVAAAQTVLPGTQMLREAWGAVLGRLLLPAFAAVVLLAARAGRAAMVVAGTALVALQLLASVDVLVDGWSDLDREAVADVAGAAFRGVLGFGAAAVAVAGAHRMRRRRALARVLGAAVAVAAALVAAEAVADSRARYRYEYYAANARYEAWRVEPLGEQACEWPLWEQVDREDGGRILVSTGFGAPTGHNNLRYPFLGSQLQHELVYVPITADGTIVDLAGPDAAALLDGDAWLRRVDESDVDLVALLDPLPPEAAVVADEPERFEELASVPCRGGTSAIYRALDP